MVLFSTLAYACETYFIYDETGKLIRCNKCGDVTYCS